MRISDWSSDVCSSDLKAIKAANKRWNWVKKGAPVIVEVGGRDLATQNVSVLRRHRLYNEASKLDSQTMSRDDFLGAATAMLQDVQQSIYDQIGRASGRERVGQTV